MSAKKAFDVGDIMVYARGENWLCSFQTPGDRCIWRATERKARQIDELVSRQAWEKLEDLDEERKKPTIFQAFICQDFLTKYCDWSAITRQGNASRLKMLCVEWGRCPLSSITARERKAVHWPHPAYANGHIIVRNDREILRASLLSSTRADE